MKRKVEENLLSWYVDTNRMPLLLRGARQVGKTWLVRQLAKQLGLDLIEINFELAPNMRQYFSDNEPQKNIQQLEIALGRSIPIENALLFLDEVQVFPEMLAKLRWYKEMMPELAVIATGSLLEFVLDDHDFSMPVGRISYMHLEPLSFDEYLFSRNKKMHDYLQGYDWHPISDVVHNQCLNYVREYMIVGGLPAAMDDWLTKQSLIDVNAIHHNLLQTYRDDFSRYKGRLDNAIFDELLSYVPNTIGQKFVFSHVNRDRKIMPIKQAYNLIRKARIIHSVQATHANGVPLKAELNTKFFKSLFIDVGLMNVELGLNLMTVKNFDELMLINKGAIAEQLVGQLLRTIEPYYIEPEFFYWQREVVASNAEVDYVLAHNSKVIPIEVKSSTKGAMQSLHLFMGAKQLKRAVRISLEQPAKVAINTQTSLGDTADYELCCLPIYLIGQLHRLLDL